MTTSREVRLKSRPSGLPTNDHFEIVSVTLPDPAAGEVQVKNTWMTVDPYMRGRMYDGPSYAAPFQVGQAMDGGAVGTVVKSNDPAFKEGDTVQSGFGWREAFNAPAKQVQKLDTMGLAPQLFLGSLGMPGLTAYAGLMRIAGFKTGDVVFVSGGAGAVGSMVAQIAKLKGGTVVATAGGADKVAFLKDIGVDHAIDYKAGDLAKSVTEAVPGGIDIYFDNVGGDHLEAAIGAAKNHARFAICGGISAYNNIGAAPGPKNFLLTVGKRLKIEGFIVSDHWDLMGEYAKEMSGWIKSGKVQVRETVEDGIDNAVNAFLKLFSGGNLGKMLVKL
ncbi:Putative NADP-dependent oxidoreductase YfmJ [Alphaproteobacteria bacterium SO-S41]|nr:Putative NADP-dependent oxidoreductase YfmJ [Alphaproteobacteria bacterium SO-S41]